MRVLPFRVTVERTLFDRVISIHLFLPRIRWQTLKSLKSIIVDVDRDFEVSAPWCQVYVAVVVAVFADAIDVISMDSYHDDEFLLCRCFNVAPEVFGLFGSIRANSKFPVLISLSDWLQEDLDAIRMTHLDTGARSAVGGRESSSKEARWKLAAEKRLEIYGGKKLYKGTPRSEAYG